MPAARVSEGVTRQRLFDEETGQRLAQVHLLRAGVYGVVEHPGVVRNVGEGERPSGAGAMFPSL